MRRNYGLTAFPAVAALVMSVAGCQEEPGLASLDDLAFDVRIETVGSNDVTALVRHNGTDDITYYAFCYRDFTQGETLAVENAVADLKASGTSATEVLHTGSSASVTCSGLQSSTMYRLVVVGLDEDYNVYGTPASVYFNTVEGVVLYEENPDWIVSYQGKQTASDNSGYGDVIQVTLYNTENSFFAFTVPLADYEAKGIAACIEEAIAEKEESFAQWEEEGYIVDRSDYIYNSTAAFILETGDEGEYVGIAAGVDENFKATGLYAVSAPFTPEPVEYSDAYGRWLGEWTISGYYEDENGIDHPVSYDITIDYLVPNEAFLISGYQVGYDGVQLPGVQATFSAESGNIVFMSSFAGEQYVGNNYYSIYFYATRTAGVSLEYLSGNYTIATAAMASDQRRAEVTVNSGLTASGGTPFGATEMQFMAQVNGGGWTAFSQVPQFPFTMVKKQ